MTTSSPARGDSALDAETAHLVRIAAAVAGSDEQTLRVVFAAAMGNAATGAVEEVILQSYLFAGFPRALNAARTWRSFAPLGGAGEEFPGNVEELRARGERTCATVYGDSYAKLRDNIRGLHPALDEWMIVEGYGKVLSRAGLDLKRRELCVVAACAATGQRRQLHSHVRGALNSGASTEEVAAVFDAIEGLGAPADLDDGRLLLAHVARS